MKYTLPLPGEAAPMMALGPLSAAVVEERETNGGADDDLIAQLHEAREKVKKLEQKVLEMQRASEPVHYH